MQPPFVKKFALHGFPCSRFKSVFIAREARRLWESVPRERIGQEGYRRGTDCHANVSVSGQKHSRLARLGRFAILLVSSCSANSFIRHRRRNCPSRNDGLREPASVPVVIVMKTNLCTHQKKSATKQAGKTSAEEAKKSNWQRHLPT